MTMRELCSILFSMMIPFLYFCFQWHASASFVLLFTLYNEDYVLPRQELYRGDDCSSLKKNPIIQVRWEYKDRLLICGRKSQKTKKQSTNYCLRKQ